MKNFRYKVLVTAAGFGQRLGEITKYTNKALVRVGKKPAISYIIEAYPKKVEFVITLRYFADQVKDFLRLAYPDRRFTFVKEPDEPVAGRCFSLGNSMTYAKKHLQCPFIFQCCDTLVTEPIPPPRYNWNGVTKGDDAAQYSSVTIADGKIQKINAKGALNFDGLHIGLVGIHDYRLFWEILEDLLKKNPKDSSLNDCQVITQMLQKHVPFLAQEFPTWFDTGNVEGLHRARERIYDSFHNLEKLEESLFLMENSAIKFFFDPKTVQHRVERNRLLGNLVPKLEGATKNFYRYEFVKGELYSRAATPGDFSKFLTWAHKNLWKPVREVDAKEFKKVCHDFYHKKTRERVDQFLTANSLEDRDEVINDEPVPSLKKLLSQIDFDWLCEAKQYQFHGDFILDNILKTKTGYKLIDWRQDFGGLLKAGDIYYDLAKLNHNLTVNHDIINDNLFSISTADKSISCDILRKQNLVECQEIFFDFVGKQKFDRRKIKLLTALIWLNMSPLHHYPFNLFLFYFGKLHLWKALKEKN